MSGNDRQQRILAYIEEYVGDHGFPPTIREIGHRVGITSTSVVNYHLKKLTEKGMLTRAERVSRGLRLPESVSEALAEMVRVPLLGLIQAGLPIPVPEARTLADADEWVDVTGQIVAGDRRRDLFALRVKGESMIDALVGDGDIVILEAAETANNGEMVAAWIRDEEETTLKRYFSEGADLVRLQPANPTMKPLYYPAENVRVQGRVVAVIRTAA